jgi:glycosyltransferase involved in cell wall biosynthesis
LWRRRSAASGLGGRIHFLGFIKNVPDLLAACDALVSPTHYDFVGQPILFASNPSVWHNSA